MIRTNNVQFQYGDRSFSFPDFELFSGASLLIGGPSGCGKTTFLHLLAGLLTPTNGELWIGETAINKLKERKRDQFRGKKIGIIFQENYFVSSISIMENLLLANVMAGELKNPHKAIQLLKTLDLFEHAQKKPEALSTGQLQRASIARAFMNNPQLVLADEPTSGLDDANTHLVFKLLQKEISRIGSALIIVSHDLRLRNLINNQITLV